MFGKWTGGERGNEELVVCRRDTETVEIHCHGGHAAVQAICQSLSAQGCKSDDWAEFVKRREDDPIAADALVALSEARTERVAAILMDQYRGALRNAVTSVIDALRHDNQTSAQNQLLQLRRASQVGLHLTEPWRIVIAGPANAGKSSLINALLGYQRSIVFNEPGTTRDVVTANTAFDGWPVELADTAGFRHKHQPLEAIGQSLAEDRVATADLVVLVFDISQPWSTDDQSLINQTKQPVLVHNKCDLATRSDDHPDGYWVSAKTGEGLKGLIEQIVQRLVPTRPAPGSAVPFRRQHALIVYKALHLMETLAPSANAIDVLCKSF